jgi:hypothetical protein
LVGIGPEQTDAKLSVALFSRFSVETKEAANRDGL